MPPRNSRSYWFGRCGCRSCRGSSDGRRRLVRRRIVNAVRGGLTSLRVDGFRFGGSQNCVSPPQKRVQTEVFRVVRDGILVFHDASTIVTNLQICRYISRWESQMGQSLIGYLPVSADRAFGGRPVRDAVAGRSVKAEQLCAHAVVFLQSQPIFE